MRASAYSRNLSVIPYSEHDEETISSHGDRSAGQGEDFVTPACAVAGVDENRQVAAFLDCGHDRQIERITGVVGKGAHPALAEHHVVIAFREDVLRCHKEFVKCGGHSAFQ